MIIVSEWQQAKRTGSQLEFFVFWGFTFLAWGGLVLMFPLIVLSNLK